MDNEKIKEKLKKIFFDGKKEDFGRGEFYQSLPIIELNGQRPTKERLSEYMMGGGINILNNNQNVLDIGCNCGFLDLTIAQNVKSVTGIEYNKKLVKIGKQAAKCLKVKNVKFIAIDYNRWQQKNRKTYDVIFSFAVHYWLKVTPQSYTKQLFKMLNPNGYIFFESQNLKTVDVNFEDYCKEFVSLGMDIVRDGTIKDDGVIERRYLVFHKKDCFNPII